MYIILVAEQLVFIASWADKHILIDNADPNLFLGLSFKIGWEGARVFYSAFYSNGNIIL